MIQLPALIDCHVHFREPGFTHKATMQSEALAAEAAGVRTVCEMPNTDPPAVTVEAFARKVAIADGIQQCDIRFFFGATAHNHLTELRSLWTNPQNAALRKRCCGLKLFFDHSTGDQGADMEVIQAAFSLCAELGIPIVAHCENPAINESAKDEYTGTDVAVHSLQRPPGSEEAAVLSAITLAKQHNTHLHVAHLSTMQALTLVREAKKEGVKVSCEVTPHHLFLSTDDYATLGTFGKMNPPLRSKEHQQALWEGIADGTVDCIATDHAPHTIEEKQCPEPLSAPSGVPGVETLLPLLLSVAAGHWPHPQGGECPSLDYEDIARLCFVNPNTIFNLHASAEPALHISPSEQWEIRAANLHSKCGWTPFEGWKVVGKFL